MVISNVSSEDAAPAPVSDAVLGGCTGGVWPSDCFGGGGAIASRGVPGGVSRGVSRSCAGIDGTATSVFASSGALRKPTWTFAFDRRTAVTAEMLQKARTAADSQLERRAGHC